MNLLNTAVGLNPWVRPGYEAAHMMVDTINDKVKANPEIIKQYSLENLEKAQAFWVNSYVRSQGLVNPAYTGALENSTIDEYAGRGIIFVVLIFLAYIFYMIRKGWFRQTANESKSYDDFFNKYL